MEREQEQTQTPDLVLVHMSADEVKEFSRAQGGLEKNEELDMPQFIRLGEMISDPEFRETLKIAIKGYINSSSEEQHQYINELDNLADSTMGDENQIQEDLPNQTSEIQYLEAEGTRDDTELVLMPKNLLYFFWENIPENMREINPHTGFPQFGLLSFLGSLVGGVAGFFIGGPIGSAIGAGLGNFGGNYGDELDLPEEKKSSFGSKLLNAGMAGGLGYLGGQHLPGMFGIKDAAVEAAKNAAPALGAFGLSDATQGASSGIGSFLSNNTLPLLGFGNLALGANEDRKNHQNKEVQNKSAYDQYRNEIMNDYEERKKRNAPFYQGYTSPDLLYDRARQHFKKGGEVSEIRTIPPIRVSQYIPGDEPGQADNIHVQIPKGSRVIDAISVAHLGDGNSEAGAKLLDKMVEAIPSEEVENPMDIDCAIAAGEYVITPDKVAGIGKGNLSNGHKILDNFIKKLRKHKKHSIHDIPPESKDIKHYLGKNFNHILKRGA